MAQSHATGWGSDAPTFAQIKELFSQMDSGRITRVRLQGLLANQPIPETVHISGSFPVQSFTGPDAIARHLAEKYGQQKGWFLVNDENYPQGEPGPAIVRHVHLLYFGRLIGTDEALREMHRLRLEPAPVGALLSFGAQYREIARRYSRVVSLAQFHSTIYARRSQTPEPLAVTISEEKAGLEARALPEDIWSVHDSEVRFAVVKEKAV